MPIIKVPVLHKFGIISHRQRVELQKRLLETSKHDKDDTGQPQKNPLEVSEEFVQRYNAASAEEKSSMMDTAHKMLLRSKRRCGISTQGEGEFVNLAVAWSELTVLAQCKGKLQEDCLNILCTSLNHAPLLEENVPTLFFLAESSLYWLQTDVAKQQYLRAAEIKLLKMGQLVFTRLLYHHLSGHLRGLADFKSRLHTYMDGTKDLEHLYRSYPNALLSFHFIRCAGEKIVGPYAKKNSESETEVERLESVPALAASVYRALCIWKHSTGLKSELKKAVVAMFLAAHELCSKNWLDGFLAISLLGEAGKKNLIVCKSLQDLARGVKMVLPSLSTRAEPYNHFPSAPANASRNPRDVESAFQEQIGDIISDIDTHQQQSRETLLSYSDSRHSSQQNPPHSALSSEAYPSLSQGLISTKDQTTEKTAQDLIYGVGGWSWEVGCQYVHILTDICVHGSSAAIQKTALLGKWQDADVTTFRAGAPNPCVQSSGVVDLLEYRGPPPQTEDISEHIKKWAWTWKIRYTSLSGLILLTRTLHGCKHKDGMRSAAWSLASAIQESPTTEERVLEAISVAQVDNVSNENKQDGESSNHPINLWSRIASSLSEIYLAPLTPSTPATSGKRQQVEPKKSRKKVVQSPRANVEIKKPTIKEEILIHTSVVQSKPSYAAKASLDLKRIVSDQWRKDIMNKHTNEESLRLESLKLKREENERKQAELLQRRREKLKGRPTAELGPYSVKLTSK